MEAFSSGRELDFSLLQGRWRLEYTTARDVLPLVAPTRGPLPPPLQVLPGERRGHKLHSWCTSCICTADAG